MSPTHRRPLIVRLTRGLEEASVLDGPVRAVEGPVTAAFGTGRRASLLRGDWLGHAVHPILTDVTLGSWTSATVLDLVGGKEAASSARLLVGTGLLTVGPTAWTGWAEWTAAGPRDKRVGLVHAVTNGSAAGLYAASWLARKQGRHDAGARLALAGAAVSGFGSYLGGHLASGRKVGTSHPAYLEAGA